MHFSMTGFGKAQGQIKDEKVSIEIKTLNSKTTEVYFKTPYKYKSLEIDARKIVTAAFIRGKIEILIYIENEKTSEIEINIEEIENNIKALQKISKGGKIEFLKMALLFPNAFDKIKNVSELEKEESDLFYTILTEAIEETRAFRKREGEAIGKDIISRIKHVEEQSEELLKATKSRRNKIREKLITEIKNGELPIDENRLEVELIYYLEKTDITEELVRLASHIEYFITTYSSEIIKGKKLGFIIQEIGREVNTVGSKCKDADIQKRIVIIKDELEKIREQVLNIV